MQIDEIEAHDPQPTAGLNPEPDADPKALDPNGAYGGKNLDAQPDGDRQLSTDSDAIDSGLNDSDLGAEVGFTDIHELGPDVTGGQAGRDATGDGATGIGSGLRE